MAPTWTVPVFLFLRMWFLPPMSCLRSLVQHHVFLPVKQMIFVAWFRLLPGVSIFIWGFLVILRIPEVFSRRFMKWNATIIVAFRFFFNPHELTKIVLQKFFKILLQQIALFGLAN